MAEERWVYDTRCRRCGDVAEWVIGPPNRFNESMVRDYVFKQEKISRLDECDLCGHQSILDVIGYRKIELQLITKTDEKQP